MPSEQGIKLPPNFVTSTNEDHTTFILPLCYPEPFDATKISMYPKNKVYEELESGVEYSIEEIRARRYINRRLSNNRLTVGHAETQQAIQSILGEVKQNNDEEDKVKVDVAVRNESHLSMQETQERYYSSYEK